MTKCKHCTEFFKRYRCSAATHGECDCPKCQGYCKCDNDPAIRDMFGLDASVDLDRPRHHLEFMSYREAAKAYVEKWGEPK